MFSRVCLQIKLSLEPWRHVAESAGTDGHTWTERRDKEHRLYWNLSLRAQLTHGHSTDIQICI